MGDVIKLIFLGNSGVGKSNIINRIAHFDFDLNKKPTIGIDYYMIKIVYNDKTYKVQLWDTAGQERFLSIVRSYYYNIDGAVIVYDITNYKSFKYINYWLDEIKNNCNKDVPVLILGNKSDLDVIREVSIDEATKYANDNNLKFIEVSALENLNIDKIYDLLIKQILDLNVYKENKVEIPKSNNNCYC